MGRGKADRRTDAWTDIFPLCSSGLSPLWGRCPALVNLNHTILEQGMGTADHIRLWAAILLPKGAMDSFARVLPQYSLPVAIFLPTKVSTLKLDLVLTPVPRTFLLSICSPSINTVVTIIYILCADMRRCIHFNKNATRSINDFSELTLHI